MFYADVRAFVYVVGNCSRIAKYGVCVCVCCPIDDVFLIHLFHLFVHL